jgi:hypothetical protein
MSAQVTIKGKVIAEIVAANPTGRLKEIEYDHFGAVKRIEWHDDPADGTPSEDTLNCPDCGYPKARHEYHSRGSCVVGTPSEDTG